MSTIRFTLVVDMSPEATAARLREAGQLYTLAMSLQQAQPVKSPMVRGRLSAQGRLP